MELSMPESGPCGQQEPNSIQRRASSVMTRLMQQRAQKQAALAEIDQALALLQADPTLALKCATIYEAL